MLADSEVIERGILRRHEVICPVSNAWRIATSLVHSFLRWFNDSGVLLPVMSALQHALFVIVNGVHPTETKLW